MKKQRWKRSLRATPEECRNLSLRRAEPSWRSGAVVPIESSVGREGGRVRKLGVGVRRQEVLSLPTHHQRHNAGAKTVVILIGIPAVYTGRSRIEQQAGLRAARMMLPRSR